jgi:hypothetical protein
MRLMLVLMRPTTGDGSSSSLAGKNQPNLHLGITSCLDVLRLLCSSVFRFVFSPFDFLVSKMNLSYAFQARAEVFFLPRDLASATRGIWLHGGKEFATTSVTIYAFIIYKSQSCLLLQTYNNV